MKNLLFILSLIFSLNLSAQNPSLDTLVKKHFPNMDAENYLTMKTLALFYDSYEGDVPEEFKAMLKTSDEGDSLLLEAIVLYVKDQRNFSRLVDSAQAYGQKFPNSEFLTEDDIATALRLLLSECLTAEAIFKITTIRAREE